MNGFYTNAPPFEDTVRTVKKEERGSAAMTESEIADKLKKGSSEALCAIIDLYTAYVSTILYRIIGYGRREDCEELTADTFIAVWNNRHKLRKGKVKAYIGEIARNKAYNFIRDNKETLPLDEEILFGGDDPQEYAEKKDHSVRLKKALSRLEPENKELVLRYYFYGQKLKDAAKEMKINSSTAKSRLKRSREELRDILGKEDFEP